MESGRVFFPFLTRDVAWNLHCSQAGITGMLMFNQIMVTMGMYHVCLVATCSSLI